MTWCRPSRDWSGTRTTRNESGAAGASEASFPGRRNGGKLWIADPSLREVLDLDANEKAERATATGTWERSRFVPDG